MKTPGPTSSVSSWLIACPTSSTGCPRDEWIKLLRKHDFAVDALYLPRAALMTLTSALTSVIGVYENRKYGPKLADVEVGRPLFILGHWRSGTTHLHNLLAQDEQFAYPNMWQVLNPHTFLSTERYSVIMKLAAPKTRIIDNVAFAHDVPSEDEFATGRRLVFAVHGIDLPPVGGLLRQVPYLPNRPGRRGRPMEIVPVAALQEADLEV